MTGAKHGFRQVHATRPAQGNGTAPTVGVCHVTGYDGVTDYPTHVFGRGSSTGSAAFRGINAEQPHTGAPARESVPVNDTWLTGDHVGCTGLFWTCQREHCHCEQQAREQADSNRPNCFRRWINAALGMGTPGEWVKEAIATFTFCALLVALGAVAVIFSS